MIFYGFKTYKMTPEELYTKEFGDAESIPKESVIRLLQHFARVLQTERQQVKNLNIPAVIKSVCVDCLYYLTCNHQSRDKQICDNYDNEP